MTKFFSKKIKTIFFLLLFLITDHLKGQSINKVLLHCQDTATTPAIDRGSTCRDSLYILISNLTAKEKYTVFITDLKRKVNIFITKRDTKYTLGCIDGIFYTRVCFAISKKDKLIYFFQPQMYIDFDTGLFMLKECREINNVDTCYNTRTFNNNIFDLVRVSYIIITSFDEKMTFLKKLAFEAPTHHFNKKIYVPFNLNIYQKCNGVYYETEDSSGKTSCIVNLPLLHQNTPFKLILKKIRNTVFDNPIKGSKMGYGDLHLFTQEELGDYLPLR